MKTIKFKSNFGRFAYSATTEIGDEVNDATTKLCVIGVGDCCFRAGGSGAEKALVEGKFMTKDQSRSEVAYSPEAAAVVAQAFNAKLAGIGGVPKITLVVTGEHQYGETQVSRVMATKMYEEYATLPAGDPKIAATALAFGFDEEAEDTVIIEAIHQRLAGLRSKKAK